MADDKWGVERIVRSLADPSVPTLRIKLAGISDADSVLVGNMFADECFAAFNVRLFGHGLPASYAISVLNDYLPLLGRSRIVLSHADLAPSLIEDVLERLSPQAHCVVTTSNVDRVPDVVKNESLVMSTDSLRMTLEEAIVEARHCVDRHIAADAWREAAGAYSDFLRIVNSKSDLPPLHDAPRITNLSEDEAEALVELCVRQSRWIEAFEIATERCPALAVKYIHQCAQAFLDMGLFDRLWVLMNRLPGGVLEHEDTLYWYFSAALAVNQYKQILPRVERVLEVSEAPDLRARWAAAVLQTTSLREAHRAYAAKRTINTARALGFVCTMNARFQEALSVLTDALTLAEAVFDGRQSVATALDISHTHLFIGDYAKAKHWASWGLEKYATEALGDELLRLNVVNQLAYSYLLTDEVEAAHELLNDIHAPEEQLGIPMMEGIASTKADAFMLAGHFETAVKLYRRIRDSSPRGVAGYTSCDLAKAHIRAGQRTEASAIALEAQAVTGDTTESNRCAAEIAFAHATAAINPSGGRALYENILRSHTPAVGAQWLAQVVLGLSAIHFRGGAFTVVSALLDEHSPVIDGLGFSGWNLLLPDEDVAVAMWQWRRGRGNGYEFSFLGQLSVASEDGALHLTRRFAEVLTVLALNPRGLSSEALLLEIYGEDGRMGSLKALLSRLRQVFPLESQPYRITHPFTADFLELERLIGEGRVREALELYKGPLLPESEAPGVQRARERLDETVRQAVLHQGERDLLIRLAKKFPNELELWERAQEVTPHDDPAYPLVRARVRRIRGEWGL